MELHLALEAILFAAQKPLTSAELRDLCRTAAEQYETIREHKALIKPSGKKIEEALEILSQQHEEAGRSYRLVCVAGAWQFVTHVDYAPWVRTLVGQKPRPPKLSQPALETLAIVAYRQPLTRAEAEQIRGVSVDGVVQTLLERGLIEQRGRAEVVGRPMTYGTTEQFLEYFGLKSLDDLPAAPELLRVEVERPDALQTVDPGLETAPEDHKDNSAEESSTPNNAGSETASETDSAARVPTNENSEPESSDDSVSDAEESSPQA